MIKSNYQIIFQLFFDLIKIFYLVYLSENLKYLRKLKEVSASDLAKIIKKSPMTVFDYESGRSSPPVSILLILSRYYDLDLNSLVLSNLQSKGIKELPVVNEIDQSYNKLSLQDEIYELRKQIEEIRGELDSLKRKFDTSS